MTQDNGAPQADGLSSATPMEPQASPPKASIPSAEYEAMRRVCDPMMEAVNRMTGAEIALAMRGLYATSKSNCPWYAYALRHTLPPVLATVGHDKEGYEDAWQPASAMSAFGQDAEERLEAKPASAVAKPDAQTISGGSNEG